MFSSDGIRSIEMAAQAGQLELNVMMPLIAYDLIHSIEILGNALQALTDRCILGITANPERCNNYAEGSLALVTALNTHIGYLNAANVAKESLATGKSLRQIGLSKCIDSPRDFGKQVASFEFEVVIVNSCHNFCRESLFNSLPHQEALLDPGVRPDDRIFVGGERSN